MENCSRTQNEQILYMGWKNAERERNLLINKVEQLQSQINFLQKNLEGMEKRLAQGTFEYFTDEEELAKETQWIRVKGKNYKKRRLDTSLTPPQNGYIDSEKVQKAKKTKPPLPFIVDQITNFNNLHEQLSNQITGYQIKIINNAVIKINVTDGDSYRLVAKMLEEKGLSWHTYENKQNRPIKVVANKLHHSCKPDKIVEELSKKGFKILDSSKTEI